MTSAQEQHAFYRKWAAEVHQELQRSDTAVSPETVRDVLETRGVLQHLTLAEESGIIAATLMKGGQL